MEKHCSQATSYHLTSSQQEELLKALHHDWRLVNGRLERTFNFTTFQEALNFLNLVGEVVEEERHFPDLELTGSKVKIKMGALPSKNDFIFSRRLDSVNLLKGVCF